MRAELKKHNLSPDAESATKNTDIFLNAAGDKDFMKHGRGVINFVNDVPLDYSRKDKDGRTVLYYYLNGKFSDNSQANINEGLGKAIVKSEKGLLDNQGETPFTYAIKDRYDRDFDHIFQKAKARDRFVSSLTGSPKTETQDSIAELISPLMYEKNSSGETPMSLILKQENEARKYFDIIAMKDLKFDFLSYKGVKKLTSARGNELHLMDEPNILIESLLKCDRVTVSSLIDQLYFKGSLEDKKTLKQLIKQTIVVNQYGSKNSFITSGIFSLHKQDYYSTINGNICFDQLDLILNISKELNMDIKSLREEQSKKVDYNNGNNSSNLKTPTSGAR